MTNQLISRIPNFPKENFVEDLYNGYTTEVDGLFTPLRTNDKVYEVAFRVFIAITFLVVYPLLALTKKIDDLTSFSTDPKHLADTRLKKQINWLKGHHPAGWQRAAMKLIKQGRHTSPSRELKRLRKMKVLTSERESKLDHSLSMVVKNSFFSDKKRVKMLMAQALEIKDIFKQTHHVFIHAQATKWVIFSHIVKECMRRFKPDVDLEQFKFLRTPADTSALGFLKNIFAFFSGRRKHESVQQYLKARKYVVDDSKGDDRDKLLSVDGYFFNYQTWESSLFFLINNDNIFNNADVIEGFAKKVFKHFCPKLKNKALIDEYAEEITQAAFKKAACGNLFVICIPKEHSPEIQYRAHPYGSPCTCHSGLDANKILSYLQGENFDSSVKCYNESPLPQYRLYTPKLGPGEGKAVYLLTPFSKAERKQIKGPVKRVADELFKIAK